MKKVDIFKTVFEASTRKYGEEVTCLCWLKITDGELHFLFGELLTEDENLFLRKQVKWEDMPKKGDHIWHGISTSMAEDLPCVDLKKVLSIVETFGEVESPEELLIKASRL